MKGKVKKVYPKFKLKKRKPSYLKALKVQDVEKKVFNARPEVSLFGQAEGTNTPQGGCFINDITPQISQGVAVNERVGNMINISSINISHQIQTQKGCAQSFKYKLMIFYSEYADTTLTNLQVLQRIFQPNIFTGLFDYFSTRNSDYYREYKLVYAYKGYIKENQITSVLRQNTKQQSKRFGHNIRFSGGSTTPTQGQYWMVLQADSGNCDPSLQALGIPNLITVDPLTGSDMQLGIKWYFTDS